jgi:hypothetical protein
VGGREVLAPDTRERGLFGCGACLLRVALAEWVTEPRSAFISLTLNK